MDKKFTSRRIDREPNLAILHNGGGTQSGTLIEMIYDGLIERPTAIIQADTGDEPAYIYRQWERDKRLMTEIGVPYIVVNNGNMHDDLYGGKRFAAMPLFTLRKNGRNMRGKKQRRNKNQMTAFDLDVFEVDAPPIEVVGFGVTAQFEHKGKLKRQCTSNYKIEPIERELRVMLLEMNLAREYKNGAIHVNKDVLVESWLGYTIDEIDRVNDSNLHWQYFRYPLIEMKMSKADCIQWLSLNGKPKRLSSFCKKCPLIGNKQMRELRDNDPDGWNNRLLFDDHLRDNTLKISATRKGDVFIHPSMIPMRDVNIDDDSAMPTFLCSNVGCMT